MSLWIYIRHRPSRRDTHQAQTVHTSLTLVVRKSNLISRSVKNDRTAVAENTGSVVRIQSKFVNPFPNHNIRMILTKSLSQKELRFEFFFSGACNKERNRLTAGSTSQKLAGSNELNRITASA